MTDERYIKELCDEKHETIDERIDKLFLLIEKSNCKIDKVNEKWNNWFFRGMLLMIGTLGAVIFDIVAHYFT